MVVMVVTVLLNALVVLAVARLLPGIRISGYGSAVSVAAVYGILSYLLKWLLVLLSLPLVILSFGLFLFVINGFLLWVTDKLIDSFEIRGFLPLALATLGITLGQVLVDSMVVRLF